MFASASIVLAPLAVVSANSLQDRSDTFTIAFKVKQAFTTVTGRFKQFGGTVQVDREHPEKSSVTATIQVKSIDTGIAKRDPFVQRGIFQRREISRDHIYDRSMKQTGPDAGDILGDFTMHGVTKPITLHVKLLKKDEKSTRWEVTTAPLSRREFGTQFSSGGSKVFR